MMGDRLRGLLTLILSLSVIVGLLIPSLAQGQNQTESPALAQQQASPEIVAELEKLSTHIVTGQVKSITSFADERGVIYSEVVFLVDSAEKGVLSSDEVLIRYEGGTITETVVDETGKETTREVSLAVQTLWPFGDSAFICTSSPQFYVGERAKLYLEETEGTFYIVYDDLGKLTASQGDATTTSEPPPGGWGYDYTGLHWEQPYVWYVINENGTEDTVNEFYAVQLGFNAWEKDVGSAMDFDYLGLTNVTAPSRDDWNVVDWVMNPERPFVARVYPWENYEGFLGEADMVFNDRDYTWDALGLPPDPRNPTMDVQNVATHEAGHFLLLKDIGEEPEVPGDPDRYETMYRFVDYWEKTKRDLYWGDLAGIRHIYPHTHQKPAGDVGYEAQGGDIALGYIDGDSIPDSVMAVIDNPSGENRIWYWFGWDLSEADGKAASWSNKFEAPFGIGWENQGLGVALEDLDGNLIPELMFLWVDNPAGQNAIYYRIGWNLNTDGTVSRWDQYSRQLPSGWEGWENQGAGVRFANLDGDPRPDMVVMRVDNPGGENTIHYIVGWNVNENGDAAGWSVVYTVPEWVGGETQGAGITIANLDRDENTIPDYIMMWVDNPSGDNTAYYRIGWNVDANGYTSQWSRKFPVGGWFGERGLTAGAGISSALLDFDFIPDLMIMWIDDIWQENRIYYRGV